MSAWTAFWVGAAVGGVVMFVLTIHVFTRTLRQFRVRHNDGPGAGGSMGE